MNLLHSFLAKLGERQTDRQTDRQTAGEDTGDLTARVLDIEANRSQVLA